MSRVSALPDNVCTSACVIPTPQSLKSILVIVDPTVSVQPAVDKAVRLALNSGARLELFACESYASRQVRYALHVASGSKGDFVADLTAIVEPMASAARKRGLEVGVETAWGDPVPRLLLDRAVSTCADLIVKDTHHHSLVNRTFMTNTDWHLIRGCTVPLLLTRQKPWSQVPLIAVALDPDHVNDKPAILDRRILEYGQLFAGLLGGSMHAIHAYLPLLMAAEVGQNAIEMTTLITQEMLNVLRAEQQAVINPLVSDFGVSIEAVHLRLGAAGDVLLAVTEEFGIDILAMGAISRSGWQRMLLGSTAERVLERIACDVLIVKPPDFSNDQPF